MRCVLARAGAQLTAPERLRRLDAAHGRSGRRLERPRQGARLQSQSARRRGRAHAEQGVCAEESGHGARASCTACSKATICCAIRRTSTSVVVAAAFKWDEAKARDQLAHVHLSNLPENQAFFSGTLDVAGSFGGIFQSSVLAYGSIIRNPTDPQRFVDTSALEALAKKGLVRGPAHRHRAHSSGEAGLARERSAAEQGHSLLLPAELRRTSMRRRRRTWSTSTRSSASCR